MIELSFLCELFITRPTPWSSVTFSASESYLPMTSSSRRGHGCPLWLYWSVTDPYSHPTYPKQASKFLSYAGKGQTCNTNPANIIWTQKCDHVFVCTTHLAYCEKLCERPKLFIIKNQAPENPFLIYEEKSVL